MPTFDRPESVMRHAIALAEQRRGYVEPNPAVGAVIVDDQRQLIAAGAHEEFGGPHAEIVALKNAGQSARGATLFVTLEPCCHHGKTGPCTEAVIAAGIRQVVIGSTDPNPRVSGSGIAALQAAGLQVETGLLQADCDALIAPFSKWITTGTPWVHAKWAMSLDGKIATGTGHSQWISNPASRAVVHQLRGRMDAVIVGAETAATDDPALTARPPGPRTAARIVVSRSARLSPTSQLAQTAKQQPVIVTTHSKSEQPALQSLGVEVFLLNNDDAKSNLAPLLQELGRRGMTNVLVEGGSRLLGSLNDAGLIDEFHVFIAPKVLGGQTAMSPLAGLGVDTVSELSDLSSMTVQQLDDDIYIHGFLNRNTQSQRPVPDE